MAISYFDLYRQVQGDRAMLVQHMHKYVDLLQPSLPGEVLDIGCGWGYLLEALNERGLACQGIDISAEQVAEARSARLPVKHVNDTMAWLREQIAGGRRWAAIFLLDVIEHLPAEAQVELAPLLATALLPGGRLVMRNPNPDSVVGLRMMYIDYTHRFTPTATALEGLLLASGFREVSTRDEPSWLDPWPQVWPRVALRPKALVLELFYRLGTPLLRAWRRLLIASELGIDQARRVPLAPNYVTIAVR